MASSGSVWGIDIGQCALKALRCRATSAEDKIEAEAFDYIEYPKILSQPDANPAELVDDALKQFLSRNTVKGDSVAISVSGQAGLARFIKLPPVEAKKIPDIVRYEAKQQIPFDLNDVIWDYQRLGLGTQTEGFELDTEIGLFAMKRDAVFRALEPFTKMDIEIDYVQLTPLALYNYLLFDQLRNLPTPEEYDPENPPESTIILSLGTDATDLVITNGYKVWQRSIPLGGNHFTKALTKEMKLTFAKAEHLKRNATAAADPKAVFQAMRPVFNELLTQLQRSIGYFSNLDRSAKIGRIVALGNAMKLPGLRRYLVQSLGYEIERVESFHGLTGSQVISSPAFNENAICFGVCYGLVLQGLGKSGIHTNLLPKEIVKDRLIKRKKPWAIAAVASILAACGISFAAYSMAMGALDEGVWKPAADKAKQVIDSSSQLKTGLEAAQNELKTTDQMGQQLVGNIDGRLRWLELMKAINVCLPQDNEEKSLPSASDKLVKELVSRNRIQVTSIDCQYCEDVATWFSMVKQWYQGPDSAVDTGETASDSTSSAAPASGDAATAKDYKGPSGPGWIIKIEGRHYHNPKKGTDFGPQYVRSTLIDNLLKAKVELPNANGTLEKVSMKDLGISYPVLVDPKKIEDEHTENPFLTMSGDSGELVLPRFNFTIHFCWQPKTPSERRDAKETAKTQKTEDAAP